MTVPVDKIRRVGGQKENAYTYYPVLIIGAGESGIAMGCRLRQVLGFDQFRIFDRQSALGGTWQANRYPGIACDVPSMIYSFSFNQNPYWTCPFPSGPEIVSYLYETCERFKILDKIQCNTSVTGMRWMEAEEEWEVTLSHLAPGIGDLTTAERKVVETEKGAEAVVLNTEIVRAKIVCSAVGGLVEPKPPIKVPGIDSFEGPIVHTARWDPKVDFRDKSVVVIGTGCSAAQVLPQLLKPEIGAKQVTQLLRSPPWVVPSFPKSAVEWWEKWMPSLCTYIPGFQNAIRKLMMLGMEVEFMALFPDTEKARANRQAKAKELLRHLRKTLPEKYHEILIPDYEVFCKRRVIDEGWFRSLQDPKADITSLPLTRVGPQSVTLGPGRNYPPMSKIDSPAETEEKTIDADVIVMANGYETGEWLHPLDVTGKGGRSLYKVWDERGGSQAYLGTAMDNFPNFFLIFGPNTATGHSSVILATENMVNYSLNFIKPILKGDVRTYEVKEEAERKWTADIQRDLKNTVFQGGGCKSWYFKNDGKGGIWNATVYPRSQIEFSLRCMFPRWSHWNATYTRKGLLKLRLRRILQAFVIFSTVAGIIYSFRVGMVGTKQVFANAVGLLRAYLRQALDVVRSRI